MAVGRITGPLLKSNLLRNGVNLAFETNLLYLDVVNGRVGIKTTSPAYDLDINGTTRTSNLTVTTQADLASFTISGNTISSTNSQINLTPNGVSPVVYQGTIVTGNLQLSTNTIATTGTNTDLNITTTGTGVVNVNSNMLVNGNLHATGNITADGNITFGNAPTDTVTFAAEVASNIIPDGNNTRNLGSNSLKWANTYTNNVLATSITASTITGNGINLTLPQGNIFYVATNGSDSNAGVHENNPFATIKYALSQATSGTTVYIYAGTYTEIFPMTIPAGVTVKGAGIRAVNVQPTAGTISNDAFLLNGQTTVEDLSITGFRFNAGANTGYGFKLANNFVTTSRSPYIRNVSILTKGSVTSGSDPFGFNQGDAGGGAYFDGSVALTTGVEVAVLFHSVTMIVPARNAITATNGVRIEWLNSFSYFANYGIYLTSGSSGIGGAGLTRLEINTKLGTWNVGNTVTSYASDGTTVLATGTIASIVGNYVNLTGKCTGFQSITNRTGKTVIAHGSAQISTAQQKYGQSSLLLNGTTDYVTVTTNPDFAFPSTISRLAKTITANGQAAVSATQSKFGGGSIAFDGTGDYLSVASNADFNFGTGDFTVECWVYRNVLGAQHDILDFRTAGTSQNVPRVTINSANVLSYYVAGATRITGGITVSASTWHHIAVSRQGTSTKLFLDGIQAGSTWTDTTTYIQCPVVIGAQYSGSSSLNGYIDEIRVSNTARYTTTFTPSTTAFTADSASKLLIHGDSTIVDDTIDGTATDFTVEGWIYPTAGSAYQTLFDFRSASIEQSIFLGINTSNQIYLYVNGVITITTAATVSLSTWTHVALVRRNASTKIYLNGTQSGSSWVDITSYGTTNPLCIGADYSGAYGFTGYIDDVKISNGVAKYTSNFTAPVSALTPDSNTVLLLNFNGVNTSTSFIDNGFTQQDIRTNAGGTASIINFANYNDFGSEFRSIGSAMIYGNYGVYGNGDGITAYLISTNFAYVGSGSVITNDPTLQIIANQITKLNGANIYYTSIDNVGNFNVGDYFNVNQKTGNVTFNGQSLNITSLSGVTFTDGTHTTTILPTEIDTGNIKISGNDISSIAGPINITASSNQINLQNNTTVTGNLTVSSTTTLQGNTTLGTTSSNTVNFVAGINSNFVPSTNNTYNLGTGSYRWANAYLTAADINGLTISNNIITTTATNADLQLQANGVGRVYIPNNNVQIDQSLTVTNNLTVTSGTTSLKATGITGTVTQTGNFNQTGNFTTSGNTQVTGNITATGTLTLPQITISGNTISTSTTNTDINLIPNGTGSVVMEGIKITNNNIQAVNSNSSVVLTPQGTGSVVINSNQSLQIPVGTSAQQPGIPTTGMIRYNNTQNRYEGWTGSYWSQLSGVIDQASLTKITPELTPGAGDNTIRFYINGSINTTLDNSKLYTPVVNTNNITVSGNTITTLISGSNINISTPGLGSVVIGNLAIQNNSIVNTVSGAITQFIESGTGYVKIGGVGGVVIPSGTNLQYPQVIETGMTRFNTDQQLVEVYNGTSWTSVAGTSAGVTAATATDISITNALLFG